MTKEQVLQECTVEGNVVKLPQGQLDRKLYMEVAKALNLIGGAWKGGKVMGFVFPHDPTELLEQIANGESRNLKKEFQFFATPDDLADYLVELVEINQSESDWILEPSAGQGSIINAIHRVNPNIKVGWCELMDVNRTFLLKIPNAYYVQNDFLNSWGYTVNKIIANPPFSKNQDIDHIYKMYECLNEGGRIVTIASKHWQISNNKKETEFRNWLESVDAYIEEIPAGKFKESGTLVGANIIVINK